METLSAPGLASPRALAPAFAAVAAGVALGCGGPSTPVAADPGTIGVDTLFHDDFETGGLAAWQDGVDPGRHRIVRGEGGRYLEVTYPPGGDGGWLTRFLESGRDSLFVRYRVRLADGWRGDTKLLALYGSRRDDPWSAMGRAGACPDGTDFFATMLVTAGGDPGPLRFYTYYPAMRREPDGRTCWGRHGDGSERYSGGAFPVGSWHVVELWTRLDAPDRDDADMIFWLDGRERGAWRGIGLRRSDALALNALQLTFNATPLGTARRVHVDDVVVLSGRPAAYR